MGLIPKPLARCVYLHAALGDGCPCDENTMWMGDISVPLKSPEVFGCGADLTGPKYSFASVAVVTEPNPIFNLRHML